MKVFVVSSSQLGAQEKDTVNAIGLLSGPGIRHYWDGDRRVGAAVQAWLRDLEEPAWDLWMIYPPGVTWGETAPEPDWWEHQLPALDRHFADRRLDASRFARKALAVAADAPTRRSVPDERAPAGP